MFDLPPPVVLPKPPAVLVVLPNPPPLPKPPEVDVLFPKSPPPLVVVAGAPNAGLLAPNGELLFVLPKPPPVLPNPPDVAVLPPNSDPPDVVFVFAPKPPPVFELPKPPNVDALLLLLPKPKDMIAVTKEAQEEEGSALLRRGCKLKLTCYGRGLGCSRRQRSPLLPSGKSFSFASVTSRASALRLRQNAEVMQAASRKDKT